MRIVHFQLVKTSKEIVFWTKENDEKKNCPCLLKQGQFLCFLKPFSNQISIDNFLLLFELSFCFM